MGLNKCALYILIIILTTTSFASAVYNPSMQVDLDWTAETSVSVHSLPLLYNVTGNEQKEIIVAASSSVYIFDNAGAVLPGWPQQAGMGTGSSPAIGDVDGDGDIEIALGGSSKNKYVYLWHHNGMPVAGWPVSTGAIPQSTPLLVDIDGDVLPEIIIGSSSYVYALNYDGSSVPGWPKASGSVRAQPAAADLDGDGMLEIVASSESGTIYAWNHDGSELWNRYVGNIYTSAPLIINIDSDGELEVIVATKAGDIYALDHDGSVISGWPVQTGDFIWYSTPSAADIDGDGDIEIVIGTGGKKVYALHHDGSNVYRWPISVPYSVTSQANLYDIDGNGLPEIIVGCNDGNVYAWNFEAKLLSGWPQSTVSYRWIRGKPAIDDVDNDGVLELIVGSYANKLYCWDMNVLNSPPVALIESPSNGSEISEGVSITFNSSSIDMDGYISSYEWISDKDGVVGNSKLFSKILSVGEHNITLNVVDNDGLMASKVIYLVVSTNSNNPGNSGGSSGGSSGSSGEEFENIEVKDVVRKNIVIDEEISYQFKEESNVIDIIKFTAIKNAGEISATVEVLKGKSSLVKNNPPDNVYKNMNIWVGKSGFATSDNIADVNIRFKVEKSWIEENGIVVSTIKLCRYHDDVWNSLSTKKSGEDDRYIYFEAKTPGFSPFAITGIIEEEVALQDVDVDTTISDISEQTTTQAANVNVTSVDESEGDDKGVSKVWYFVGALLIVLAGGVYQMYRTGMDGRGKSGDKKE